MIPSSSASSPFPYSWQRWRNKSKWAIAAATWIQSTSGPSYYFGLYSAPLKSSQSYSQPPSTPWPSSRTSVLTLVSSPASSTPPAGPAPSSPPGGPVLRRLLLHVDVHHCRPRSCASTCSSTRTRRWFINSADVVTAVENFPDTRSTVNGIMKVSSIFLFTSTINYKVIECHFFEITFFM